MNYEKYLHKFALQTITAEEAAQFRSMARDLDPAQREMLEKRYEELCVELTDYSTGKADWKAEILERIHAWEIPVREYPVANQRAFKGHVFGASWLRYAAMILLIGGASIWLFKTIHEMPDAVVEIVKPSDSRILTGNNHAILTLADGSTIVLDSATNGRLAAQGNARIVKVDDGHISYHLDPAVRGTGMLNTMTTPRGGMYQLSLPDGTKVWLNAASSITYPVAFAEDRRDVTITGEVYFEVAADKTRPFMVKTNYDEIRVLGTRFNINSYNDEPTVRTSLIEGSIRVNDVLLKPGQAYADSKVERTDVNADLAWTKGTFHFYHAGLPEVLRQFARWYDLEIKYESIPVRDFTGELGRDLTIMQVLKVLEYRKINYTLNGKTLTIRKD